MLETTYMVSGFLTSALKHQRINKRRWYFCYAFSSCQQGDIMFYNLSGYIGVRFFEYE